MPRIAICPNCDVVILEPTQECPICHKPIEVREVKPGTVIGSQSGPILMVEPQEK